MLKTRIEKEIQFRQSYVASVADKLFSEGGIEKSTMDELASRSEMSKSTLYTVFCSKDELLIYMHLRDAKIGYDILRESLKVGKTGYEQLYSYGKLFFTFYQKYPEKLILRSYIDFRGLDTFKARTDILKQNDYHRQKEIELFRQILSNGMNDGSLKGDLDADLVMTLFIYSLHPITKQSLFPTHKLGNWTAEIFFNRYLKLWMEALRNHSTIGD